MTYHTVCKTNDDFINALKWARNITANITRTMNHWPWNNVSDSEPNWEDPTSDDRVTHYVYPYRYVHQNKTILLAFKILSLSQRLVHIQANTNAKVTSLYGSIVFLLNYLH